MNHLPALPSPSLPFLTLLLPEVSLLPLLRPRPSTFAVIIAFIIIASPFVRPLPLPLPRSRTWSQAYNRLAFLKMKFRSSGVMAAEMWVWEVGDAALRQVILVFGFLLLGRSSSRLFWSIIRYLCACLIWFSRTCSVELV